jgi:hypothetical protein
VDSLFVLLIVIVIPTESAFCLKSFHNWLVPKSIYCRVRHIGDDARRPPKMWCILCCVPESTKTEVATQSRVDSFSAVLKVQVQLPGYHLSHGREFTSTLFMFAFEWCEEAMCSFVSLAMTPVMVVRCHLHGTTDMLSRVGRRIGPGPNGIEEGFLP